MRWNNNEKIIDFVRDFDVNEREMQEYIIGTMNIEGISFVGGILGHSYAQMSDCSIEASGSINASNWQAGGLIGSHYASAEASILNCSVTGEDNGISLYAYNGAVAGAIGKVNAVSNVDSTTIDGISVSNIDLSKVKIYYSENGEATKDLNTTSNRWTLDTTNLANVKSYLIVLQDVSMNTADTINFTYDAQIPANLQYNESAFENYVVYFNNNLDTGTIQDKQLATKIGITTGRGPVLEASMTSNVEETQEVLAGDIIKYTLTVKNIGTENANDVIATLATEKENEQEETEVVLEIPEGLKYVEQDEENPENYNVKASSGKGHAPRDGEDVKEKTETV